MRIVRVETEPIELALKNPYAIAGETFDRARNVLVHVVTDGRHVGVGCAAPEEGVTGERFEDCLEALQAAGERLRGADPLRRLALLERLAALLDNRPAARAALDMALLDLLGKVARLPCFELLGGFRDSITTSVTLGISPLEETVREARRWVGEGFVALKIKGGRDPEDDVARVLAVRAEVGGEIELRFDANQGYSAEEAKRFVAGTGAARVELLEQPTPRGRPLLLQTVSQAVPIPVMADESVLSLGDAFRLARGDLVDMLNVKLQKVGGVDVARRIDAVARAARYEVMVGCMDELALGISAGLHFALSSPNVRYADLDGHLELVGDPTASCVRLEPGGVLRPSHLPGLGWDG